MSMSHPKKPRLSWMLVLVLDLASEYGSGVASIWRTGAKLGT
jgi:hypothetical protein